MFFEEKIFLREFFRLKEDLKGNIDKFCVFVDDIDKIYKKFIKVNMVVIFIVVIFGVMSFLGLVFVLVIGGGSLLFFIVG